MIILRHLCLIMFFLHLQITPEVITFKAKQQNAPSVVTIKVILDPKQILFSDQLVFTVNNPDIKIEQWEANKEPAFVFDKIGKETVKGFTDTIIFNVTFDYSKQSLSDGTLFMHYMLNTQKSPREQTFSLFEPQRAEEYIDKQKPSSNILSPEKNASPFQDKHDHIEKKSIIAQLTIFFETLFTRCNNFILRIKNNIIESLTTSDSIFWQMLIAFLLGILMSFTPCIYPMIPITIGILGTTAQQHFIKNFLLAFSYAFGISTTFALFGMLATACGTHCGQLLGNVWFVIPLVLMLLYLAFSMFGWYEVRIPKIFKPKINTISKKGSYFSSFIFGMGSGSISSPCMSPGLALLLSIVANSHNKILGFILLFAFGMGTSIPLLIIGTFSASMHLMPRAGIWMVEFKKIFGFMLLGICIIYLKNIIALPFIFLLTTILYGAIAIYYLFAVYTYSHFFTKFFAACLSTIFFIASLYSAYTIFTHLYPITESPNGNHIVWESDYDKALKEAISTKKKLLLDFGASWCSLCTQLEQQVLYNEELFATFQKVVLVKIDGSRHGAEPYTTFIKTFSIHGLPALILLDPETSNVIKRWNSSLLETPLTTFKNELETLL